MPDNFWFLLSVFVIAILLWIVRTLVESDPDPFFLNLTFFAFAGQVIKSIELFADHVMTGEEGYFVLGGILVISAQVIVMRKHRAVTLEHYEELLATHKRKGCSDAESALWAELLLRMTGVDLRPGGYNWFAYLQRRAKKQGGRGVPVDMEHKSSKEPRKKSREQGFMILPKTKFDTQKFSAMDLIVPSSAERKYLWRSYVGLCIVAWALFGATAFYQPNTGANEMQRRDAHEAVTGR